jgi:CheY-like chemotaxis protein
VGPRGGHADYNQVPPPIGFGAGGRAPAGGADGAREGGDTVAWGDAERRTILVAEDDACIAELLDDLLSEAGYHVVTVGDGRDALLYARRRRPAMVLADCMMPGLDGPRLAQELRRDPATRAVPIVLMSSAIPRGTIPPDVPFLAKPFDIQDVLDLVDRHARAQRLAPLWGEA